MPRQLVELLSSSADAVVAADRDGRICFINHAAATLAGAEPRQAMAAPLATYFPELVHRTDPVGGDAQARPRHLELVDVGNAGRFEAQRLPFGEFQCIFLRSAEEKRRLTEALDAERQRFAALLDQPQIGIMHRALDGRILAVNEPYCRILGRSAAELDGLPVAAFTHPDDLSWNLPLLETSRQTGEPFHVEKRYLRPDGEVRWCTVSVSYVRGADGQVNSTIACATDVTEGRAARHAAEQSRELLQTVVDSADDLIFVKDTSGKFILANRRLSDAVGPLVGKQEIDQFGPDLSQDYLARDREVMAADRSIVSEYIIPIGGERRIFQTAKVPWKKDGRILGVIGIGRDISDRVAAEQALRRTEERYRLAARATDDAIWDWDLESDAVLWNDAAERLFGEAPGTAGDWWKERIHPEDRSRVIDDIEAFVAGDGAKWQCEYRLRRADGSYAHVLDRGYLTRRHDGEAARMIGAVVDLTERFETAARLRKLQAELVHVSRTSAMGTMASALAHELNQPLTAASNYARAARRSLDTATHQTEEIIGKAIDEIMRAGEIIRRLRHMVARGRSPSTDILLRPLLIEAIELGTPTAMRAEVEVVIDVDPAISVCVDAMQLQQVLVNVVRNAVEAMAACSQKRLVARASVGCNRVSIELSDSGPGIAPEIKPRLFSAFTTTKANGAGVGLSICRTIVESYGGSISLDDGAGRGATCLIALPR